MTVNPQRVARLQEYGLTEYEARAYLALLELEKAEASQIADLSRVPRTKIYQALDGLEGKKLIKVIPERPKRCLVQPFSNYLDELEVQLRNKADTLAGTKDTLVEEFAPKGRVQLEAVGGFIVLKGRANIASKLAEITGKAQSEVTVATSEMGARRFAYTSEGLAERAENGCAVRILAPIGAGNKGELAPLAATCEIRHSVVDLGAFTIAFVDDREVMLVHHVPDDHHYFQGTDVALWSDDAVIVAALRTLVNLSWSMGVQWDGKTEVVATTDPAAAAMAKHITAAIAAVVPA